MVENDVICTACTVHAGPYTNDENQLVTLPGDSRFGAGGLRPVERSCLGRFLGGGIDDDLSSELDLEPEIRPLLLRL